MLQAQQQRAFVFYASRTKNTNGDYNWYQIESLPEPRLSSMQKIVGGNITILAHKRSQKTKYIGYANDEGLVLDLPRNDLAGGALYHLGFLSLQEPLGAAYAGTVILMRMDEKPLTKVDITTITNAIVTYRKEMASTDAEEGEEEEEF